MKKEYNVSYTINDRTLDFKNAVIKAYNLVEVIRKIEEKLNHDENITYIVIEEKKK